MNQHPYLRAYMAGIALPTGFLLVAMTGFIIARLVYNVPIPIERVIVFPMAVIPNLWGVWNMLYVKLKAHWRVPIGIHGDFLVLIILPLGLTVAKVLDFQLPYQIGWFALPVALAVYYLAWKYIVNFLNEVLGVA
ncbi:hypothetical protein L0244_29975 [bacterium]|nr:hypothetical protein [bacterium]